MANTFTTTSATEKSVVGFSIPQQRVPKRTRALFLCPLFMAGGTGAPSGAPFLFGGDANLVPSVALLSISGGGFDLIKEETAMPKLYGPVGLLPTDAPTSRGYLLDREAPTDLDDLVRNLPWILREVLALYLSDRDPEMACKVLVLIIDRLSEFENISQRGGK